MGVSPQTTVETTLTRTPPTQLRFLCDSPPRRVVAHRTYCVVVWGANAERLPNPIKKSIASHEEVLATSCYRPWSPSSPSSFSSSIHKHPLPPPPLRRPLWPCSMTSSPSASPPPATLHFLQSPYQPLDFEYVVPVQPPGAECLQREIQSLKGFTPAAHNLDDRKASLIITLIRIIPTKGIILT